MKDISGAITRPERYENLDYSVGDPDSKEKGSGARANSGKADYSLQPLYQLVDQLHEYDVAVAGVLNGMANFQITHNPVHLYDCMEILFVNIDDKADLSFFMDEVCKVWADGKIKYNAWNWSKGMPWSVALACGVRHILELTNGFDVDDKESGHKTWAHAVCNIQMLIHYTQYYPEGNDLPIWGIQK